MLPDWDHNLINSSTAREFLFRVLEKKEEEEEPSKGLV